MFFRRKLSIVLNAEEMLQGKEGFTAFGNMENHGGTSERVILVEEWLWERTWKGLKAEDVEIVTGAIPEPRRQ